VLIAAVVGVVVLIAGGAVLGARVFSGGTEVVAQSPGDAADREGARLAGQQYLQALAAGDARTALSLAAHPPTDTRFLTDDVLRAQLAALPITDITATNAAVGGEGDSGGGLPLELSATFGDIASRAAVLARKVGGQWKLDAVTTELIISADPGSKGVQWVALGGVATSGASPVPIFPGIPQVSSASPYVDISADVKPVLLEGLTSGAAPVAIAPTVTLNDGGRLAAVEAINRFVESCYVGAPLTPRCCPAGDCGAPPPPPEPGQTDRGINRDTARVSGPAGAPELIYVLDPATMMVTVNGKLHYNGSAETDGVRKDIPITLNARDRVVDLSKTPPEALPPTK
jgi:hypothetical protein